MICRSYRIRVYLHTIVYLTDPARPCQAGARGSVETRARSRGNRTIRTPRGR